MSVQITTSMVEQYKDNVYHLTQQKGSRLRRACRVETVVGKNAYYEQIGSTSARKRTSRHSDTPRMDTPHARRRVSLSDYDWADLVDNEDKVRTLVDPTSEYAEAAAMAMGRSMDDEIIEAADGIAYTGESGGTQTAYNSAMTVAVNTVWPGVTAAASGLNVAKLLEGGNLLGANNVDPDEEKFCILPAQQVKSLLMDERVSSHDYNAIKPLVSGQVVQFSGFTLIPTQRVGLDGTNHKVLFWAKGGMLLGVGNDIETKISERADKNYAKQVFACMSIGATRMEEVRVGVMTCHPTSGPQGNI